jgi:hypothetical protein
LGDELTAEEAMVRRDVKARGCAISGIRDYRKILRETRWMIPTYK